jgi:hypothetical protein
MRRAGVDTGSPWWDQLRSRRERTGHREDIGRSRARSPHYLEATLVHLEMMLVALRYVRWP